jgi:peptide/nickel transport system substrate-binding protein
MKQTVRHSPGAAEAFVIVLMVALVSAGCRTRSSAAARPPTAVLRVGVSYGNASMTSPIQGTSQIIQNATTEGLARVMPDGRMEPQLAEKWSASADGRSLRIDLKRGLRFSDGSPVDANVLATILPGLVRDFMGPAVTEGVRTRILNPNALEVDFPYPSLMWIEALEAAIRKPGTAIATGPFSQDPGSTTRLRATDDYYLGRPSIDFIDIKSFPSVRSAWAELLRNNIDMLYEVGPDALDSLEGATSVSVFRFIRPYQYNVSFNAASGPLRSPIVRQALNFAIDREQLVRVALNGHGLASNGPLREGHWAIESARGFSYDPQRAARLLNGQRVRFTCLLPTDAIYERIALEIKRQVAAVGIEMDLKSVPPDELFAAERSRSYEAALHENISGPTLLRLYLVWHSHGAANIAGRGTPTVDAALDKLRAAMSEQEYRQAVREVQRAFVEDPPAMLLAWSERARAISKRFIVPAPQPGMDVWGPAAMRLWTPRNDERFANRN